MQLTTKVIRLVVLSGLAATVALAQESRATLSGSVTDPTGAVIAGVKVKLTNEVPESSLRRLRMRRDSTDFCS